MIGPYPWACFHHRGSASALPVYHRHNEVELTFLYDGSMTYELDGLRTVVPNRKLCLFWGGIPHRCVAWGGRGGLRVICLPMSFFFQSRLPHRFLKSLLSGHLVIDPGTQDSGWDEYRMESWERDIRSGDPALLAIVENEIDARLRRLVLTGSEERRTTKPGGDALSRLLGILCAHAGEPLTVSEMAGKAGLHPKYAFRLFKQNLGMTALEYLHRLRVSHAQRLLATTDRRIAEIAFESGFNSVSQFYETFRQICGESPGKFRRSSQHPA